MRNLTAALAFAVTAMLAAPALASYHTFKFSEIYSNADGTVQFIELHEVSALNGQSLWTLAPDIQATGSSHTFTFVSNLPSGLTANKFVLLGTSAFAALPGAPTPDYIIPANFFSAAGDTLQFGSTGPDGIVDTITWTNLTTDGIHSFSRTGTTGSSFTTITNSPTDLAGTSGSVSAVPEPATAGLLLLGGAALLQRRRRHR